MNVAVFSSSSEECGVQLDCCWPYICSCCLQKRAFLQYIFGCLIFRLQLQIGDGASFIFLNMWAPSRLKSVCSLMTTTCCRRSRKWKSSLSALPQGCSDEGLLFLEGDTVVLLSSFGSTFTELVCFFISWKTTVG